MEAGTLFAGRSGFTVMVSKRAVTAPQQLLSGLVPPMGRCVSFEISLAAASSKWQHKFWNLFRTGLVKLRRVMANANPLCRRFLTIGVTAMAVVVILLSTASRRPYTGTNSASWHTTKASRMSLALQKAGVEAQALCRDLDSERQPRNDTKVSFFAFALNPERHFFVLGVDKFRSPPTLF